MKTDEQLWIFQQSNHQFIVPILFILGCFLVSHFNLFFRFNIAIAGLIEMATFKLSQWTSNLDWEKWGDDMRGDHHPAAAAAAGLNLQLNSTSTSTSTSTASSIADPSLKVWMNDPKGGLAILNSSRLASTSSGSGEYYPGLANAAGNLCFLNATLQSLASLPSLTPYLRYITLAPLSSPVSTTLLQLLNSLNTPTSSPTTFKPFTLASALANSSKTRMSLLSSSEQQDAQELWGMIREAVEEEWVKAVGERIEVGLEGLLLERKDESSSVWSSGANRARSLFSGKGKGKEDAVKDPFAMLVGQKIRCAVCSYTRDVRHTAEEFVQLNVPNMASCRLDELLSQTYGQTEFLSEYNCRKCSLLATKDKLVAQRDRLALPPAPSLPTSSSSSSSSPSFSSIPSSSSSTPSNPFSIPPSIEPQPEKMTQSRKDRKRKVQKLVDKISLNIAEGDYEKELGEEIKIEKVWGPAGKEVKIARVPKILTIHLSRSSHFGRYSSGVAYKNSCQVLFPELLDLSPYEDYGNGTPPTSTTSSTIDGEPTASTTGGNIYRLSSLVVHYGSHSFGHYVAFRRRPLLPSSSAPPPSAPDSDSTTPQNLPEWYRISDETVEPSRLSDVMRANPFLMFYEKVEGASGTLGEVEEQSQLVRPVLARTVESWMAGKWTGITTSSSSTPSPSPSDKVEST